MNLKERIQTVLQKLNLLDKAKANQLTQEEWGQIVNSYNQEYQSILQDDLAADQAAQRQTVAVTQEQIDQVQYRQSGTNQFNSHGRGKRREWTGADHFTASQR